MIHIECDEELGEVRIMSDVATMATTRSRNVARRIRDALNAPNCIEGQMVEWAGKRGVVQAFAWSTNHDGYVFLVRIGTQFKEWEADNCMVIEPTYDPKSDAPGIVCKPMTQIQAERDLYRKMLEGRASSRTPDGAQIKATLDQVDEGLLP